MVIPYDTVPQRKGPLGLVVLCSRDEGWGAALLLVLGEDYAGRFLFPHLGMDNCTRLFLHDRVQPSLLPFDVPRDQRLTRFGWLRCLCLFLFFPWFFHCLLRGSFRLFSGLLRCFGCLLYGSFTRPVRRLRSRFPFLSSLFNHHLVTPSRSTLCNSVIFYRSTLHSNTLFYHWLSLHCRRDGNGRLLGGNDGAFRTRDEAFRLHIPLRVERRKGGDGGKGRAEVRWRCGLG